MNRKKKWMILCFLSCIFIAAAVIRSIYLTRLYPTPEVKEAGQGETLTFNGCEFRINSIETYRADECPDEIKTFLDKESILNTYYVFVNIHIENTSKMDSTIEGQNYILTSGLLYDNQVSLFEYETLNPGEKMAITLSPKESKDLILPFLISQNKYNPYSNEEWEILTGGKEQFDLIISLYPIKNVFHISQV